MNDLDPQRVYARAKAIEIGAVLKLRGLPVLGVTDLDCGRSVGVAFQLGGAKYGCRCKVEVATPEWFEDAYRTVA